MDQESLAVIWSVMTTGKAMWREKLYFERSGFIMTAYSEGGWRRSEKKKTHCCDCFFKFTWKRDKFLQLRLQPCDFFAELDVVHPEREANKQWGEAFYRKSGDASEAKGLQKHGFYIMAAKQFPS